MFETENIILTHAAEQTLGPHSENCLVLVLHCLYGTNHFLDFSVCPNSSSINLLSEKKRKLSVFCNIMARDRSQRYQQWSWGGLGFLRLTADKLFQGEKLCYWHAVWCWSKLGMQEKQIAPHKEMGGAAAGAVGAALPSAAETDSFPPVHFPIFRKVCRSDCGFGDV